MLESYAQLDRAIVDKFNEHARELEKARETQSAIFDESFHAFMCNAISLKVTQSERGTLKAVFAQEAITD